MDRMKKENIKQQANKEIIEKPIVFSPCSPYCHISNIKFFAIVVVVVVYVSFSFSSK